MLKKNINGFNCYNTMTFKLAQYIIDFAIYKLEMEGIQIDLLEYAVFIS